MSRRAWDVVLPIGLFVALAFVPKIGADLPKLFNGPINSPGTLQLLAACEQTPTIQAVVVRGSAGIYGAEPAAPQFYTEEMARLYPLRTRFQRDIGEIENYFEGYARRHLEVVCTMLRYQPSLGPGTDSQVTRYLGAAVVPTYLGFDPRMQFVHEDDVVGALTYSTGLDVPGIYNVAGDGMVTWSEVCRIAGRSRVPLPPVLAGLAFEPLRAMRLIDLPPEMLSMLRYGRGVDNSRFKRTGFKYKYTTAGAVDSFARGLRLERAVGSSEPDYTYERDVETFFRHSPAIVRDRR